METISAGGDRAKNGGDADEARLVTAAAAVELAVAAAVELAAAAAAADAAAVAELAARLSA